MKTAVNAFLMLVILTLLTGVIYPLAVTAIGQATFPAAANGSLIVKDGRVMGSRLIGRAFTGTRYFQPRPSATGDDAMPSGASNLSPASAALADTVAARRAAFRAANGLGARAAVPEEMLFASGSRSIPTSATAPQCSSCRASPKPAHCRRTKRGRSRP